MVVDWARAASRPSALELSHAPVVSPSTACLLALLTGILYFLAFAGTGIWILVFVTYVPLMIAYEGRSAKWAFVLGGLAGLTMNLLGFHWLYWTLTHFTRLPAPVCGFAVVLLCVYQAGRVALFSWLQGRARERGWWTNAVALLAFVASEAAYPLLFPWYFAACVHQVPALLQAAELGGPCAVGLVLFAANLAVAETIVRWCRRQAVRLKSVLFGLLTPSFAAYAGLSRMEQIDDRVNDSEPVHIGLVQGNMPLVQTWRDHVKGLQSHLRMGQELSARGAEFVVWSETTLKNVPEHDYDRYLERFFVGRVQVPTIVGALLTDGKGQAFNAALATDAHGRIVGRYDKRRLLFFAEAAPFGETFPGIYRWLPNTSHYTSGISYDSLPLGRHLVTALICYEDLFPGLVNDAVVQGGSEMMVNLTNDGWFGDSAEPQIHLALAKLRAVEHRRFLIRATNSGVSALVDPVGRVIVSGGMFREEAIDAEARWMRPPRTGYEIWGDVPWWVATMSSVLMAFIRRFEKASGYSECLVKSPVRSLLLRLRLLPNGGKTSWLRAIWKGTRDVSSSR